jgi:hypothetical protein
MTARTLTPLLAAAALGASGCGDGDSKESAEKSSSPRTALRELGETRTGLEAARAAYGTGDKKTADDRVASAYLDHFEHVEGPLEARDEELTEELEDGIREELRDEIKTGTKAGVDKLFTEIFADLDEAEGALR